MSNPLDVEMAALSVAAAVPHVNVDEVANARNAFAGRGASGEHGALSAGNHAQHAGYDDATCARHGRVAGRSVGIGFRHIVGENLDGDTENTLGDILGEMFGIANRHTSRSLYLGMLGLAVLPVVGVIVWKAYQPAPKTPEGHK